MGVITQYTPLIYDLKKNEGHQEKDHAHEEDMETTWKHYWEWFLKLGQQVSRVQWDWSICGRLL